MEHKKAIKLSIIIPIYNRQHTLSRCLESIKNMSFQDYEVLMIDDGSTDDSSSLCKIFEKRDKRFHYFYKDNGGVSSARNWGLEIAQGVWVTFIDSDDFVLKEHFSILDNPKVYSCNLVTTGILPIQNYRQLPPPKKNSQITTIINRNQNIANHYFLNLKHYNNLLYSVFNKCFLTRIIKDKKIEFPKRISLGEDQIFINNYLVYATQWLIDTTPTYCQYLGSSDGLSFQKRSIKNHWYCLRHVYSSLLVLSIKTKSIAAFRYSWYYLIMRLWQRVIKLSIKRIVKKHP